MSSLDLHGIKHSEVQKLMDSFLFENMKSKQTKVEIITGLSDQMKNVVKKVLNLQQRSKIKHESYRCIRM